VSERPKVGLFDSGVGGLSVLRELAKLLPGADYVYVADSIHCPYGSRSDDDIRLLSRGIAAWLIDQGVDLVVVACNTASAAALCHLRQLYSAMPFVGMVPAIKPAALATRSGVVGVLATPVTYQGQLYHDVVDHLGRAVRLISRVCPGLVARIEEGDLDGPLTVALLRTCLEPMLAAGADTLVLGCTHYPFVIPAIRAIAGQGLQILEPSEAVAQQAVRVLGSKGECQGPEGQLVLATTGPLEAFTAVASRLLGRSVAAQRLAWDGELRLSKAPTSSGM
jgi:glutamate racemase